MTSVLLGDELDWCEETAAFLATQGQPDVTAADLRAFHAAADAPAGSVYREVACGTAGAHGRDLGMVLYARRDRHERRPAVVIFHGGGFRQGTAFAQRRQAAELAGAGIVAASAAYRFAQEATFPAALEDAKCAVRYLRAHHAELGVDPDRIAVAGGSAGGYLAAMVALTPGCWEGAGGHAHVDSHVNACVLFCPLTDMRAPGAMAGIDVLLAQFLGVERPDEDLLDATSPVRLVHPDCPPTLTLTGDGDAATPLAMVRAYHDALDAAGVTNELVIYEGRAHAFGLIGDDFFDVVDRMASFLKRS